MASNAVIVCSAGRGGALFESESPVSASEADVVQLLETVLRRPKLPAAVKEVVLTAATKLTARLPTQVCVWHVLLKTLVAVTPAVIKCSCQAV